MVRTFTLQTRQTQDAIAVLRDLNEEQRAVVTAQGGPMLVVAGAGTGKTRALTHRLAWLVHQGVDPTRVLLVTFTNRAAREMLHRVQVLIEQDTHRIWGGTFHHIANRILRRHGKRLGIAPDFTILDREDSRDLIGACVADAGVNTTERRFPQKNVLAKISSFVQNTLDPLDKVLAERVPDFIDDAAEIQGVLDVYVAKKRSGQLLDYDDLLARLYELLRDHEPTRELLANQFVHVLVDEYQDTNAIQGAIVDMLASSHGNVCVVGDDSQSIYSFRGASFENILRFRDRYPDAREYRLETNYRSTPEILSVANGSIAHNERRLPKELRAVRPPGIMPAVVTCYDHLIQSRFIAEYVLHLLDEGRAMKDVAVLYRSHYHSIEIQLELQRHNIPFQVRGGLRFFEQAHIKDVLAFLRIVHNPHDEIAWLRALQLLPKIGAVLARRFWVRVEDSDNPLKAAADAEVASTFPGAARSSYGRFVHVLGGLSELGGPSDMIEELMREFYDDVLRTKFDNAVLRREDIRGLSSFAGQYRTVEALMADVALAGDFSGETVVTGPDDDEYVTLSTIHQAKGLEWDVVLIPWLADGYFPTDFALNSQEDEEEERRVFHVAVTRAKDEVYFVYPQVRRSHSDNIVLMKPSRFLTELAEGLTERMELEDGLPELIAGEDNVGDDPGTRALSGAGPPLPKPEGE